MKLINNTTISAKFWFLGIVLILNLVVLSIVSYYGQNLLTLAIRTSNNINIPAIRHISLIDMYHDSIRGNVYRAIIAGTAGSEPQENKEIREEADTFFKDLHENVDKITKLGLNQQIRTSLDKALPILEVYIKQANEIVNASLSGDKKILGTKLAEFNKNFEELEKLLDMAHTEIEKYIETEQAANEAAIRKTNFIEFLTASVVVFIGVIISLFMSRSLKKSLTVITASLSSQSRGVADAASNLKSVSGDLSVSTTRQANALQETSASVDEINSMVKKTEENANYLERTAAVNQESAERGQNSIQQMLSTMESIQESHTEIMQQIEDGNLKISEIIKVINEIGVKTAVINDIVFQTKLLSFNASVEAARAGGAGKGFAVVADEIGKLAQLSGAAAKEISDMLDYSVGRVERIINDNKANVESLIAVGKSRIETGTTVAKTCDDSLIQIVQNSKNVASRIQEMAQAIKEQNQGLQKITKSIHLADQATDDNVSATALTSKTSQELLDQSTSLQSVISQIQSMISGRTA